MFGFKSYSDIFVLWSIIIVGIVFLFCGSISLCVITFLTAQLYSWYVLERQSHLVTLDLLEKFQNDIVTLREKNTKLTDQLVNVLGEN